MLGPKQWPARVRLVSAQPTWVRESHTFRPPRDERSRLAVAPLYHAAEENGRDRGPREFCHSFGITGVNRETRGDEVSKHDMDDDIGLGIGVTHRQIPPLLSLSDGVADPAMSESQHRGFTGTDGTNELTVLHGSALPCATPSPGSARLTRASTPTA